MWMNCFFTGRVYEVKYHGWICGAEWVVVNDQDLILQLEDQLHIKYGLSINLGLTFSPASVRALRQCSVASEAAARKAICLSSGMP